MKQPKQKMNAAEFREWLKQNPQGKGRRKKGAATPKIKVPKRVQPEEVLRLEIIILQQWKSTNEILSEAKAHFSKYMRIQKKVKEAACLFAMKHKQRVKPPVKIAMHWHLTSGMDCDNVVLNQKFVIDGIVQAGVLPDDSPRYFPGPLNHSFQYGCAESLVIVKIEHINIEAL